MPNALVRAPVTNWTGGSTVLNTELATFDNNLARSVNGVDGSCHAPTAQIILAGPFTLTGPLRITRGGTLTSGAPNTFRFSDGDYPLLSATHTGRTHKRRYPCAAARGIPRYLWKVRREDFGLQAYAPMYDDSSGVGPRPALAYVPLRVHDNSTLSSVLVNYRVGFAHPSLPPTMPLLRVLRMDSNGNLASLTSQAAGADAQGYFTIPRPLSAAAWYNGGLPQTVTVPCDQNNAVTTNSFDYFLEITEEQGLTGYPWMLLYKKQVRLAVVGNVAFGSGFPATLDGVTRNAGDVWLVKDQNDKTQNGIYSGLSTPGLSVASDFAQGMVVPVDQGNQNGGAYWQASPSITSWTPGTEPGATATWATATAYPLGTSIKPSVSGTTGFWYQATSISGTGMSGGPEPSWPVGVGQTVTDNPWANQIVWTCEGQTRTALTFVTKATVPNAPEGSAFNAHGVIWQDCVVSYTGIADARPQ
jgi:hypothetical protein